MRRSTIIGGMCAGIALLLLAAAGCENMTPVENPTMDPRRRAASSSEGGIFGPGGVTLLGGQEDEATGSGIGVNSFLWRASLDTVAFMPLLSADPFGGVIITDWYAPPETPGERFKMTVYILDRVLRSDAVQVSVFRQQRASDGAWEDRPTSPDTAVSLEDKILDRARQLRTASLGG